LPPGTTEFTYAVDPVAGKLPTKAEAVQMFDLIGQRLRAAGIGNFEMGAGDALTIRIPGPVDVAAVRYLLGHPGVFEIVPLPPSVYGTSVAAGSKTVPVAGDAVDPSLPLLIADKNLLHDQVKAESTTGSWDVLFSLDAEGTAELASFSAVHVNEYIAVVLDGKVVSAPSIFGPITGGSGRISGDFTASDAMLLAAVLRNGPLAFPIHEISASNGPGSTMRDSSSSALAS
jgi:preprotein translocase subunit SecD